jgi:hypothetical protein
MLRSTIAEGGMVENGEELVGCGDGGGRVVGRGSMVGRGRVVGRGVIIDSI